MDCILHSYWLLRVLDKNGEQGIRHDPNVIFRQTRLYLYYNAYFKEHLSNTYVQTLHALLKITVYCIFDLEKWKKTIIIERPDLTTMHMKDMNRDLWNSKLSNGFKPRKDSDFQSNNWIFVSHLPQCCLQKTSLIVPKFIYIGYGAEAQ